MFLLIDKPKGITSHDVIEELRDITGKNKIGHAGTLDPNATGLLVVAVGRESTKKLDKLQGADKAYMAEVFVGEARDTDDSEGDVTKQCDIDHITKADMVAVLDTFMGEQKQVPPKYSAVRVNGRKAYELAREGEEFDIPPRIVTVHEIELLDFDLPNIQIRTRVSTGTYIRALARDIGRSLDSCAYLKNLRRIQVGEFDIEDATSLRSLSAQNWEDEGFALDMQI